MRHRLMKSFALVLVIPALIFAQSPFHAGVSIKANSSNMKVESSLFQFTQFTGLGIGLYGEFSPVSWLALHIGGEYLQKGFVEEVVEYDAEQTVVGVSKADSRLGYLTMPITLKLRAHFGESFPYLFGGPRRSWVLSRKAGVFNFTVGDYTSPFADAIGDAQWGWIVGAGVTIPIKEKYELSVEFSYDIDQTAAFEIPLVDDSGNVQIAKGKTEVIALSVFFGI